MKFHPMILRIRVVRFKREFMLRSYIKVIETRERLNEPKEQIQGKFQSYVSRKLFLGSLSRLMRLQQATQCRMRRSLGELLRDHFPCKLHPSRVLRLLVDERPIKPRIIPVPECNIVQETEQRHRRRD